ncbi:MAG: hypothetical protein M1812_004980 [Candelaria pacifica]|nr:MAG: hypothetical protein M1812_004980 [Candelaria pacifica]
MSGNPFLKPVASVDASVLSFSELSTQHQHTHTTITPRASFGIEDSETTHGRTVRTSENKTIVVPVQQQYNQACQARHFERSSKPLRDTKTSPEVVLHQGTVESDSALATPGLTSKEGLAAKRRERQTSKINSIAHDVNPTAASLSFISVDPSKPSLRPPGARTKRTDKPNDAWRKLCIKERGDTCSYCFLKKKVCDADIRCHRCVTDGKFCLRGIDQLWLWKAISQGSLRRGSRQFALQHAQRSTFEASDAILPTLPSMNGFNQDEGDFLLFNLTNSPTNPAVTSHLAAPISQLTVILESGSKALLDHLDIVLSAHVPGPFMDRIVDEADGELRDLLRCAEQCFRIFGFLAGFNSTKYHASMRSLRTSRQANLFLIRFCARALLYKVDSLLGKLRHRVRSTGKQTLAVRLAIGVYWRIVAGRDWLCATNATDLVLQELSSSGACLLGSIEALDRDYFDQQEDLPTFVHRHVSSATPLDHLHISHEFVDGRGLPVTSSDARSLNPFAKDFTILMHRLLIYDGKFATYLQPSIVSEAGLGEPTAPSFRLNPNRERNPAVEDVSPGANPNSRPTSFHGSHDHTFVASSSDAGTTICGSPPNGRAGVHHVDQSQLTLEDDDRNRHLMYTNIGMTNELKRSLSPTVSGSTRGSSSRKRIELDFAQDILCSASTPGPSNQR